MLSVNQLAASIKITEAWKICNVIDYPLQLEEIMRTSFPMVGLSDLTPTENGIKMGTQ